MNRPFTFTLLLVFLSLCVSEAQAVKVFFLAGQSNMQGHGRLESGNGSIDGAIGSLRYQVDNDPANYGQLVDGNGDWKTRSDVWVWNRNGTDTGKTIGDHGVTYGVDGDRFGPELGFGNVVGDFFDEQVVLIKTAWGGKSLIADFRPPSAVTSRGGTVGPYYTIMIDSMKEALTDAAAQFPGETLELVGFGWHQGFNDRINVNAVAEYEENLNDLIADLRSELSTVASMRSEVSVTDLRVVIGTTSMGADSFFDPANYSPTNPSNGPNRVQDHVAAQKNVGVSDPLAATVDTRSFWREPGVSARDQGFHWNQDGETYYLIGDSMGDAMVGLLVPEPSTYLSLAIGFGSLLALRRRYV